MSEEELKQAIADLLSVSVQSVTVYSHGIGEVTDASFEVTVKQLIALETLVGAEVTIESTDSDPACSNWGHTSIVWDAS